MQCLGGVAEAVSSNPRWVIKYFSAFTGIVDIYIYIFIYESDFVETGFNDMK